MATPTIDAQPTSPPSRAAVDHTNRRWAIGWIIAALGLNILVGFTGQISIGQAAFLAVGAVAALPFDAWRTSPRSTVPSAGGHVAGGQVRAQLDHDIAAIEREGEGFSHGNLH